MTKLQTKEASKVVAVFGEVVAQGLKENVKAGSRVVQSFIHGRGLEQIEKELTIMCKKGQLSNMQDPKVADLIWEMWRFIDEEVPDEDRVNAMRNIFKRGVNVKTSEKERAEIYQLMKICRQLKSMEIMVLKACDELRTAEPETDEERRQAHPNHVSEWATLIHNHIAFGEYEMILLAEEDLMRFKLISSRERDNDRITSQTTLRLTNLGIRLCDYLSDSDSV